MEIYELKAFVRDRKGKGPARRFRKDGLLPAIFYGKDAKSTPIVVNTSQLMKLLKDRDETIFIKLIISNGSEIEKFSIIKDIQSNPVTRRFLHADFYEISMTEKSSFDVPIHFTGRPVGIDNGGELHIIKRDLKVSCLPGLLPDFIELDITALNIGDSIKVQDIKIADGLTILEPVESAIVTVSTAKAAKETQETELQEPELV